VARLPFHTLKIDRSFVSGIDEDARQRTITEALILVSRGWMFRLSPKSSNSRNRRSGHGYGPQCRPGFFLCPLHGGRLGAMSGLMTWPQNCD
jgi:hypothetical protein